MTSSSLLPRKLVILAIILPIAAVVGYQLASPDSQSFALIGLLVMVLCIPGILRWHHALLILSWNAAIQVFFLPGQPMAWMLMVAISLTVSILNWLIHKKETGTYVPSIVWPLVALSLVVLITAQLTGGVGMRVLGSSTYGGRRYIYFFAAVLGYFALVGQRIPLARVNQYAGMYFLSFITAALGHGVYLLGPSFWILYAILPVGYAGYQAVADFTGSGMVRLAGFTFAGVGICQFVLFRFGITELLTFRRFWRPLILVTGLSLSLLGGFRSGLLTVGVLVVLLFFLEGLHRTRVALAAVIAIILLGIAIIPLASKMPFAVQRTLAILPIDVSPVAKRDAIASSEWRLRMWEVLTPEIPKYLFLGKGSAINPADLYLVSEAHRRGHASDFDPSLVAGDYHSATLSLLIQFGLWGVIAFAWFCFACVRYLHAVYVNSSPEMKRCNRFLLALFITNVICFGVTLSTFADNFYIFTGIIGFSISLNGAMKKARDSQVAHVAAPIRIASRSPRFT